MIILGVAISGCTNPFSPKLTKKSAGSSGTMGNQSTVEGLFNLLQYSYSLRDTLVYGKLLAPEFIFSYRDYDLGTDVSWGREEEMKVTYGLFQNSQRLDLILNNIISMTSDSTSLVRSFNLTVTFNPTDVVFVDGKISLGLVKRNGNWMILRWEDQSDQ